MLSMRLPRRRLTPCRHLPHSPDVTRRRRERRSTSFIPKTAPMSTDDRHPLWADRDGRRTGRLRKTQYRSPSLLIDTALPAFDQPIPNDFNHLHFGAGQTEAKVTLPLGATPCSSFLRTKTIFPMIRRFTRNPSMSWSRRPGRRPVRKPTGPDLLLNRFTLSTAPMTDMQCAIAADCRASSSASRRACPSASPARGRCACGSSAA